MEIQQRKPDIIQSFDQYVDRQYFKVTPGFFGTSRTLVRTDRIKNWTEWDIACEEMPDKVLVNGKEYGLIEKLPD